MVYVRNLLICAMLLPLQYIVVPILLLTKWDGYTTWFGNNKHGRGNKHFEHTTKGFWQEFLWLTYRNPINNLMNSFGVTCQYIQGVKGNPNIGDKIAGGWYFLRMGKYWEFYYVKPYLKKHCVRVRLGWKIAGKNVGELCPMVFAIRPIQNYSGV
jgi:hypothetical protein